MTSLDLNFAADHFSLFGLEPRQGIDAAELDTRFRDIQARVHPDKHAHAGESDRRLAMQWATRVNEAYQVLRNPLSRARYLLALRGHDAQIESNTAMPAGFLMAQMELREAVAEAKVDGSETALDQLRRQLVQDIRAEYGRLQQLIDEQARLAEATALVRQLMFQEKLLQDIDEALEAVLA